MDPEVHVDGNGKLLVINPKHVQHLEWVRNHQSLIKLTTYGLRCEVFQNTNEWNILQYSAQWAAMFIATSTLVTNLSQYINSDLDYNDLKFQLLCMMW